MGVGKSSTCRTISCYEGDLFKVSASYKACTTETSFNDVKWRGS